MTLDEAIHALFDAKFAISDLGDSVTGGTVEDIEMRLRQLQAEHVPIGEVVQVCRNFAEYVLPERGRRRRVMLVLCPPKTARARALVSEVLRSVSNP